MQPIEFLHQPAQDKSFQLHYIREARQIICSHRAVWREGAALFFHGHARDEEMRPLPPAAFGRRIDRSFDGMSGTTGVYCGALVVPTQEKLSLFCDPNANEILYWYRDGEQIIVSSNLDWLARRCQRKLHIDWQAWSETLSLHSITGSRTYFEEIKCLNLQQTAHFHLATCTAQFEENRSFLNCVTPEKNPAETSREVAALFDEGLARLAFRQPELALALSGGLDSRMILSSLRKTGALVNTFTTDTDVGTGDDPIYAGRIADAYGVPNRYIPLPDDWYENTVDRYYQMTSYESWYHVWFQGLADGLPDLGGRPILTGNDGDGLLRASHIPAPRTNLDEMFSEFDHQNFADIFRPAFTRLIEDGARQGFRQEYSRYAGLPASIFFFRLQSRMRRNIHWMIRQFSTRFECLSGFQYPPFSEYVFGLAQRHKFDPNLQIEVMRVIDPQTLAFPSTHPSLQEKYYQARIRKYNPATIAKFRGLLEGNSRIQELNLIDPHKLRALFSRMEGLDLAMYPKFVLLQPVYMLARWLETYAAVLVEEPVAGVNPGKTLPAMSDAPAPASIPGLIALFLPILKEWVFPEHRGLRVSDAYESDYDENYAPAAGAVVLAQAQNEALDSKSLLQDYLKRSGQLLGSRVGVRPFQKVFVLHYMSLACLLLPPAERSAVLPDVGEAMVSFVDRCPAFNTNCAALKLANELFLDALEIRPADAPVVSELAAHLAAAQLPSGFINDDVERDEEGCLKAGDGMPVAYHAFIVFVCICALRYGRWTGELEIVRRQIAGLVDAGLEWLARADAPDGSTAMAGRGKYHLFTRGVRCALHAFQGNTPGLSSSLRDWLSYLRPDGTYAVTLNHLPHGMRVGYEDYARVSMYNTLGMAALSVAQDILNRPLAMSWPIKGWEKPGAVEIDRHSGYAFYRHKNHFTGVNLFQRTSSSGLLPMEGFHLRLDGQPTLFAESSAVRTRVISADRLDNGVFESWMAQDQQANWHLPAFRAVEIQFQGDQGIFLAGEDDLFRCEKTLRFFENGLFLSYTLTPKIEIRKLIHALPLCITDGIHELAIHPLSPQTVNFSFGSLLYQTVCAKAKGSTYLPGRSTTSVSGIASRLQYTLLDAPHPVGKPIQWETQLIYHGMIPGETPRNEALRMEDPLSTILGAKLVYEKPLRVGGQVEIITEARGEKLEYAWYVLERQISGSRKVFVQMYRKENRVVWKPETAGHFLVMLFIRDASRLIKSLTCPEVIEVIQ